MKIGSRTAFLIGIATLAWLSEGLLSGVADYIISGDIGWAVVNIALYTFTSGFGVLCGIRLIKKLIWCRGSHEWVEHLKVGRWEAYTACRNCFIHRDTWEREQAETRGECWSCGADLQ